MTLTCDLLKNPICACAGDHNHLNLPVLLALIGGKAGRVM